MKQLKYNTMAKQEFMAFSLPYEIKTIKRITSDDMPFWVIQLLLEWRFDIANLMLKGEAIDVNTLDVNPYK